MNVNNSTRLVQASITSISFPGDLERLRAMGVKWHKLIDRDWVTDMDVLLDFPHGRDVSWIAPKWLTAGDILFFYHTKSAKALVRDLYREARDVVRGYSASQWKSLTVTDIQKLQEVLETQRKIADKYSGSIFGFAVVSGRPHRLHDVDKHFKGTIYAPLGEVYIFPHPLWQFGDIVKIGQNTTTPVFGAEFEYLKDRLAEDNPIPDALARTKPGNASFRDVNSANWPQICCHPDTKFVDEAQIRSYWLDYLLHELKYPRSPLLMECNCFRGGIRTGIADYFVQIHGKWVPIEAKLNVLVEENILDQIGKYTHIQSFQPTKGIHRGETFVTEESALCLIVDQYGIYMTHEGYFVGCDLKKPAVKRENTDHSTVSVIRDYLASMVE